MRVNRNQDNVNIVRGYVFISSNSENLHKMIARLRQVDISRHVMKRLFSITGEFDLIAELESDSLVGLTLFVTEHLSAVEGIQKTSTALIVRNGTLPPKHRKKASTAYQAFVFLNVEPSKLFSVLDQIGNLKDDVVDILASAIITGQYDILLQLQAPVSEAIMDFVVKRLRSLGLGIISSRTCHVAAQD